MTHSLAASWAAGTSTSAPTLPVTLPFEPIGPAPETKTRFPARAAPAYLPNDRLAGSDISSSRSRSATPPIGCLFALLRPRSPLSRLSRGISLLGFVTVFSRGDCCAGRQAIRRVVLALHVNHGNGSDAVPLDVHERDALRRTKLFRDVLDRRAEHYAFFRDKHQFVARVHHSRRHQLAGFGRRLERPNSLTAAPVPRVLLNVRSLAKTELTYDKQRLGSACDFHTDDAVAGRQPNSANTPRKAGCRAKQLDREADRLATRRHENRIVGINGQLGPRPSSCRSPRRRRDAARGMCSAATA